MTCFVESFQTPGMLHCSPLCSEVVSALRMLWDCSKGQEGAQHPHLNLFSLPISGGTWADWKGHDLSLLLSSAPPRNSPNPRVSPTTASVVRAGDWQSACAHPHPCLDKDCLCGCGDRAVPQGVSWAAVNEPLCLEPHSGAGPAPALPHHISRRPMQ